MHYPRLHTVLCLAIISAGPFAGALAAQATCSETPSSQVPSVQTPAAHQLNRWLETFNAGDRATWQRFLSTHFPSRTRQDVDRELALRAQTGGFDLFKIQESAPTRAAALLKERDSETRGVRVTLEVESAEPHRIVSIDVQPGARIPVDVPRLTESELVKALPAEIDKHVAADRFSGAVLVANKTRTIFHDAYGLADRQQEIPNKIDTRFRIGSMGKMFTAVAVLTLVQDGRIALDAPLGKYLTDYPNQTLASKVTIHHLLTHTGGTGDIFGPQLDTHRHELRTHQDYVKLFGARDLLFEPGSRWMYSNYGFILLGAVIEKVSGQSYYEYVREHVYEPAGMRSTGSEPEDHQPVKRAIGYTKARGAADWRPNTDTLPYRGTAAGGGYSTVEDLLRFANALTAHRLLNAHYTELLTTGKVDALGGKYAYGFIERVSCGVRSIGHGGNAPGMDGQLLIFPDSGYVVAVLANMDPPSAERVADFVANRLPER